jgi:hypothetical protein
MTSTKPSIALAALAVAVATAPDARSDSLHGLTIGALREGVRAQDFVTSFAEVAHAAQGGSFAWL